MPWISGGFLRLVGGRGVPPRSKGNPCRARSWCLGAGGSETVEKGEAGFGTSLNSGRMRRLRPIPYEQPSRAGLHDRGRGPVPRRGNGDSRRSIRKDSPSSSRRGPGGRAWRASGRFSGKRDDPSARRLLPHQPQRGATSQPQATPGVGSRDPGRALKGCHNTNDPSPYCRAPSGLMITGHREPRALRRAGL